MAKNLRVDQVVPVIPETSADRDFAARRDRDLVAREDPTLFYFLLFAGLAILGVTLAWFIGYWHF